MNSEHCADFPKEIICSKKNAALNIVLESPPKKYIFRILQKNMLFCKSLLLGPGAVAKVVAGV